MPASQRLGARITAAQHRSFVGRDSEIAAFRRILSEQSAAAILHIYGPGGTGKSALLGEFRRVAQESGVSPLFMDGRDIEPTPSAVTAALSRATGSDDDDLGVGSLERLVVLIDTYEQIAPVDTWLREHLVPELPANSVLVLAGRDAPSHGWRSDPGLSELCNLIALRNLNPHESREYLARRNVPEAQHEPVLAATHGHPLALALFADLLAQPGVEGVARLDRHPDIVHALMERFVASVPEAAHRDALVVCAQARVTTESLLADVLIQERAHELFQWLCGLSFIEQGSDGIFPNDVARDVLKTDFRWRDPTRYRHLHRRVRDNALQRLAESGEPGTKQRVARDKLFLHKSSPLMRPYFDFAALEGTHVEPARPADYVAVLDIVRRHEGDESAAIAGRWLERQPSAFQVWRSTDGGLRGFMAHLALGTPTGEELEGDPALPGIWGHVREHGGLRSGERFLIHRFWMGRDGYQDVASQTVIAAAASLLWMTMPQLAWSFPCTADADRWAPMFAFCDIAREPALDFEVGRRRYGVFAHDWRREPPLVWLDVLSERELSNDLTLEDLSEVRPPPLLVLSRPDFDASVRQALRDYADRGALAHNPLVRSRLVGTDRDPGRTAETLQTLLREAVLSLRARPRDDKLYRAVWYTYIQPGESQEIVSQHLGLPFSTFRYQLRGGLDRVAEWLWQRDLRGA